MDGLDGNYFRIQRKLALLSAKTDTNNNHSSDSKRISSNDNKVVECNNNQSHNNNKTYNEIVNEANNFLKDIYGLSTPKVVLPKNHGKLARLRSSRKEDHLKANAYNAIMKRRPELPPISSFTDTPLNSLSSSSSSSTNQTLALTRTSSRTQVITSRMTNTTTTPRVTNTINKTSKHKWQNEELDKLSQIYLDNKRPLPPDSTVRSDFLNKVVAKFLIYYPYRDREEVVNKLNEMIRLNTLRKGQNFEGEGNR